MEEEEEERRGEALKPSLSLPWEADPFFLITPPILYYEKGVGSSLSWPALPGALRPWLPFLLLLAATEIRGKMAILDLQFSGSVAGRYCSRDHSKEVTTSFVGVDHVRVHRSKAAAGHLGIA